MIVRTENICYPRSGHHLLVNILARYFDDSLKYCEYYSDEKHRMDVCPETNYQKNHDFRLTTPVLSDRKYVVQIREPFEAITSHYELEVSLGKIRPAEFDKKEYLTRKFKYFSEFCQKWVIDDVPNRLIITYRELTDTPFAVVSRVIAHITDSSAVDVSRLTKAVRSEAVRRCAGNRRNYLDFKSVSV
jgi:hypothetical protein